MINRKYYLEKIQPYLGKPVVKTITGLRRVGKSVFVRQLIEHLRNQGIASDNILYVDMESLGFDFIRTYNDLHKHVTKMTDKVSGKIYIFGLFTRICGRNPVPGVRQAGDISTLLQF